MDGEPILFEILDNCPKVKFYVAGCYNFNSVGEIYGKCGIPCLICILFASELHIVCISNIIPLQLCIILIENNAFFVKGRPGLNAFQILIFYQANFRNIVHIVLRSDNAKSSGTFRILLIRYQLVINPTEKNHVTF